VADFDAPAHAAVQLPAGFVPTCCAHPDAYVNKVLVGAADGRLALVNFVTGRVVHTFAGFGAAIRCCAPSPALDVVACGLADGRVIVHNIRFDERVAAFTHDAAGGAVTAAAFRTGPGPAVLVCGGASGALTVWDLATKRLQTVIKEAHDAPVRSLPAPAARRRLFCLSACLRLGRHGCRAVRIAKPARLPSVFALRMKI
jgi:U3 small nucleolar RNA-associated protein 21